MARQTHEECSCGASFRGSRRDWATWNNRHACPDRKQEQEEPDRQGAGTQAERGRTQDGRWIGGWGYIPAVEMKRRTT